jgi:hypothetical protein
MVRVLAVGGRCAAVVFCLAISLAPAAAQSIGLNFTGVVKSEGAALNNNSGYAPPDNAGGVSADRIVQLINGAFAVYDKSNGDRLSLISGRQFWLNAGVDPGTEIVNLGAFNQKILYDPTEDRWIAAALTGDAVDNRVLLARSETADPLGSWKAVDFLGNVGGPGKFVDYTRLGVDANGVYIATNNFADITGGIDSVSVFSVPKSDLMAAVPTLSNMTRFDAMDAGYVGWTSHPIINFGPVGNHAPVLGTSAGNTDTFLYRTDLLNTSGPGATMLPQELSTLIEVDEYSLPPKAAQPDGTRLIGLIDHRFKGNVYQVGDEIFAAHDVIVDGNSAISWYRISESTSQVIEEGILSDPDFDYFQATIAANATGDIVIAFNRSGFGPDGNISIMAVVGQSEGNLTTFGDPLLLKASAVDNYHDVNNRFGDYSTTVVDPFDPNVFWTFQEYASGSNQWATHITQIIVPEPAGLALGALGLVALTLLAWRRTKNRRTR